MLISKRNCVTNFEDAKTPVRHLRCISFLNFVIVHFDDLEF